MMFDYEIYLERNGPVNTGIGGLDKQTWLIFYKCGYCDSSCKKFNEKMQKKTAKNASDVAAVPDQIFWTA